MIFTKNDHQDKWQNVSKYDIFDESNKRLEKPETTEIQGIQEVLIKVIKVCFICHGNICRSTMAQFVFQDMVNKQGLADQFEIDSKATSTEELGNPPHRGTVRKMNEMGIPMKPHRASQLRKSDYHNFDFLIGMDTWNMRNMNRILGGDPEGKVYKFLTFGSDGRDIADPWYTGNFDETYRDVVEGCEGFLAYLEEQGMLN